MPQWLRMTVFLSVFSLLVGGTHYYLYRRLVRDVFEGKGARTLGRVFFAMAAVGMVAGVVVNRFVPRAPGEIIGYLAFGWMGVVILFVPVRALLDLPKLRRLRRGPEQAPIDPQRRLAMARGAAALTALSAGSAAGVGLHTAHQPPTLRAVDIPIPDLPAALDGFRIAHLTDIHVGPTIGADFVRDLVRRVNALDADMVAITGDLVDGSVARLGADVALLGGLKSRHGTFFCTGNHEYYSGAEAWIAHLTSVGVRVLRNEHLRLEHDGAALDVLGVDDWRAKGFGGGHGHDMEAAVAGRDPAVTSVLLAHQPKAIHDAAKHDLDLMICGHTHGGQIWPYGYFVKFIQPYTRGLARHDDRTWIYVNPGTGYWGPPMRLDVEAEIAHITLRRA
jgi:uncharacterized protein